MASTSKSFRVVLRLTEDERARLDRSCQVNFAAYHVLFRDNPSSPDVVWLATRDKARTAAASRRAVRALLKRLRIQTSGLRGTWLVLETDDAVHSAVVQRPSSAPAPEQRYAEPLEQSARPSDDKVVQLTEGSAPRQGAPRLSIELVR